MYASATLSEGWPNIRGVINRYDADGALLWTDTLDVLDAASPAGLAVDAEGTLYAAGVAYSFADDGSPGPQQGFLVAYSRDGEEQWSQTWQEERDSFATAVAVTAAGDVLVSGDDAHFLTKLDREGDIVWQRAGRYRTYGWDIATDVEGRAYVGGASENGAVLQVYDVEGEPAWVAEWPATDGEFAIEVATDAFGNVFSLTYVYGDPNTADLRKFDASGNLLWTEQWGEGASYTANGLAVAASGHVFVAGNVAVRLDDGSSEADAFLTLMR